MECRVSIRWTTTAKESLKALPKKVRRGLLTKADELLDCGDPRECCKPLKGPLQGYYRIVYSRYRAIFSVEEERLVNDDVILHLTVLFVAAGARKEHDKQDVYRVAEKLVRLVLKDDETLDGVSDINERN
jgi:mRNA-degrading endonuclease RelE of RelBE toxin-antitoxin system